MNIAVTAFVAAGPSPAAVAQNGDCLNGEVPIFSADWSAVTRLESVNAPAPYSDFHPAISPDGLSLYISSNRGKTDLSDNDIWVSRRRSVDAPWPTPLNLGPNINSASSDFAPYFSPDGHFLLFSSRRPGGFGQDDIWASYREDVGNDFGWVPAFNLGPGINTAYDENAPALLVDSSQSRVSLYFNSILRPGGLGDYDIYQVTLLGPGALGPATNVLSLNSPGRDTRVAIRGDGRELFLTSNRTGTLGKIDLWSSTRATTSDDWTTPVNLGPTINSTADDGGPAISRDGTTLYFYSSRRYPSTGKRELYSAVRQCLSQGTSGE